MKLNSKNYLSITNICVTEFRISQNATHFQYLYSIVAVWDLLENDIKICKCKIYIYLTHFCKY